VRNEDRDLINAGPELLTRLPLTQDESVLCAFVQEHAQYLDRSADELAMWLLDRIYKLLDTYQVENAEAAHPSEPLVALFDDLYDTSVFILCQVAARNTLIRRSSTVGYACLSRPWHISTTQDLCCTSFVRCSRSLASFHFR
jgi:hypothetical protein